MQDYNIKLLVKETNIDDNFKLPYLNYGIFISILIHIALFFLFTTKHENLQKNKVFYVEVLNPSNFISSVQNNKKISLKKDTPSLTLPKKQIVEDSSNVNNIAPKESRLLAENNNSVEREQIKRGDTLNKEALNKNSDKNGINKVKNNISSVNNKLNNENIKPNSTTQSASKVILGAPSSKKTSSQKPSSPKKLALKLDSDTLFKNFSLKDNENDGDSVNNSNNLNNQNSFKAQSYKPFSRAQGSGARFIGTYGSSSFLPNLPDGDLTLLNTKAEYFAVFVRRVATRVFSELRLSGWENLSKEDIYMIKSFSEVEAVMSLKGDIVRVKLLSSSGSYSFDDVLKNAALKAAKDGNPPSNAKSDDNLIHFIFQAKSWSKLGTNPNGSYGERRWLLLSTGLK